MPKLLALLPCDNAIVSKEDDTVSLITIMQGVTASVPEDAIGQNILVPHRWHVFAYWLKEADEEGVSFEQKIELSIPSGQPLVQQISQFTILRITHSQISRIAALPVPSVKAGVVRYALTLSVRRTGEKEFKLAGEFPFNVTIEVASSAAAARK
jgi:hypothetical protein